MDEATLNLVLDRAAARFEASVDRKLSEKLAPVDTKLDGIAADVKLISEKQKALEQRQDMAEQRIGAIEGKMEAYSIFTANEAFDRREDWYLPLKEEAFRCQRALMIFGPAETPQDKTPLSKSNIVDFLNKKLKDKQISRLLVVTPVAARAYRILSTLACEIEARALAAKVLKMQEDFADVFGARPRYDIPRPLQPLRQTIRRMFAVLRKKGVTNTEKYFKNYRGLIMSDNGVPAFPEFLIHPQYDVEGFLRLLTEKSQAIFGSSPDGLNTWQLEHGVLFFEARDLFLATMSVPRFNRAKIA